MAASTATARYHDEQITVTEKELMKVLVERARLREQGLYPIKTVANVEDMKHHYKKVAEDFNLSYTLEPDNSPKNTQHTLLVETEIPAIHGEAYWSYDTIKRVNRSAITKDTELQAAIKNMGLIEEGISLAGSVAPLATVQSPSVTGTNSTAAAVEFNTVDIATIHSTLMGLIGQMIVLNIEPDRQPLKLVVTGDVYLHLLGELTTNQEENGLQFVNRTLKDIGGPGSGVILSNNLGAAVAVVGKSLKYTAGTTNACLFAVDEQYYEIIASKIEQRTDGISQLKGQTIKFVERFIPIYKQKEALIYSGTVGDA